MDEWFCHYFVFNGLFCKAPTLQGGKKKNHLSPFLLNKYQIRLTLTRFLQQTPKIFGFSLKEQAA